MQASPAGLQEADLVICRRSRPVLVLHERKTRVWQTARSGLKLSLDAQGILS